MKERKKEKEREREKERINREINFVFKDYNSAMSLISARYNTKIIEDDTDQYVNNTLKVEKNTTSYISTSTHLFHHPYYHYYDSTGKLNNHLSDDALYHTKLKYGYYNSPANQYSTLNDKSVDIGKKAAIFVQSSSVHPTNTSNNNKENDYHYDFTSVYALNAATKSLHDSNTNKQYKLVPSTDLHDVYLTDYSKMSAYKAYSDTLKSSNVPTTKTTKSTTTICTSVSSQNINLSKVLNSAEHKAYIRINKRFKPESENTKSLRNKNALNAAYKVNSINYLPDSILKEQKHLHDLERQKLEFYNFMVSPKVWNLASSNTKSKLNSIDDKIHSLDTEGALFNNMDYNIKAVQYVRRQMELNKEKENQVLERTKGKIYTGGGLWIPNRDIDDIARHNVKPMIEKIDLKTEMERKLDIELDRREFTYKQEYERWKKLQIIRNKNDKDIINETNLEMELERQKNETLINEDILKFSKEMENKLISKQKELNELIQKSKDLEIELADKKTNLEKWQTDQLEILQKEHDKDLNKLDRNKMELLNPYFNILDKNEDIKMKLQDEIEAIKIEIQDLKNEIQVHDENISELDDRLRLEKMPSSSKNIEQASGGKAGHEKKTSIISVGRKGKAKLKKKHEALLISLDKEKHNQEKLVELKREKLESLNKVITERENELETNEASLLKNKEKVDLLKSIEESTKVDNNQDITSSKSNGTSRSDDNDYISEYSQYDIIKRQNELAREGDANVIQGDDYSVDDGIEDGEGNDVIKIQKAERAKNKGKATIITTGRIPYQGKNGHSNIIAYNSKNSFDNESSYGAEASASVRSVTGVSGVLSTYPPINSNRQSFRNLGKNKSRKENANLEPNTNCEKRILQKSSYYNSRKPSTAVVLRKTDSSSLPSKKKNSGEAGSHDSNSNDLKDNSPSFSGFSQGSIKDDEDQNKYIGSSSNDSYSLNENDQFIRGEKRSLFKEVF